MSATASARSERPALALLFAVALALRLGYLALRRGEPLPVGSDPYFYALIARNLVEGRGYLEINALAYRPPGQPGLLAACFALFGDGLAAPRLVLAALGAGHCLLQVAWARRLAGWRVGLLAGWLTAVYPQFVRYPHELYAEVLAMVLTAAGLWLLLVALDRGAVGRTVVAGLVFGLAALTRESGLLMPVIVGLWFWWVARRQASGASDTPPVVPPRTGGRAPSPTSGRAGEGAGSHPGSGQAPQMVWQRPERLPRHWLALVLGLVLAVLPWTWRNYRVLDALVPISTNPGINFYMGNNPAATGGFGWHLAPGVVWDDGAGELAAGREGFRAGLAYAGTHPGRTIGLWVKKAWLLWRPPYYGFGHGLVADGLRAVWLLAYLGLWVLALYGWPDSRRLGAAAALPLLVMVLGSVPFVLAYADTRYRLPMVAFLVFYSAVGLARAARCLPPVPETVA